MRVVQSWKLIYSMKAWLVQIVLHFMQTAFSVRALLTSGTTLRKRFFKFQTCEVYDDLESLPS